MTQHWAVVELGTGLLDGWYADEHMAQEIQDLLDRARPMYPHVILLCPIQHLFPIGDFHLKITPEEGAVADASFSSKEARDRRYS